jgi:hypothetical protein
MKTFKRERWIPSDMVEFKPEIGDYPTGMFTCYVNAGTKTAMFYIGKQSKHAWYIRFQTEEDMKKKIKDSISNLMRWEDSKAERKEKRSAPHSLKVGDILYSDWGYDQTNIDFYQVTRVISDKTVEIREIASKILDSSNYGTDDVVAVKDAFLTSLPMIKRPSPDNAIGISSYETAYLWNGKPKQETSFGYGH